MNRCCNTEAMHIEQYIQEAKEYAYSMNHSRFIDDIEDTVGIVSEALELIRTIGKEYGISDEDIESTIDDCR